MALFDNFEIVPPRYIDPYTFAENTNYKNQPEEIRKQIAATAAKDALEESQRLIGEVPDAHPNSNEMRAYNNKKARIESARDKAIAEAFPTIKAPSRNFGAVANDFMIDAGNAAANLVKTGVDIISPTGSVSQAIEGFVKEGQSKQSDFKKYQREELARDQAANNTETGKVAAWGRSVAADPLGLAAEVVGNAGPFAALGKGLQGVKTLSQYKNAISTGIGAGFGIGTVRGGIADKIEKTPDAILLESSPDYAKLRETLSEADAKKSLGGEVVRYLPEIATQAVISGVLSKFGLENVMMGTAQKAVQNTLAGRVLGTAAGEFATGATEQISTNKGIQRVLPQQGLYDDALLSGAQEAAVGGIAGAFGKEAAPSKPDLTKFDTEAFNASMKDAPIAKAPRQQIANKVYEAIASGKTLDPNSQAGKIQANYLAAVKAKGTQNDGTGTGSGTLDGTTESLQATEYDGTDGSPTVLSDLLRQADAIERGDTATTNPTTSIFEAAAARIDGRTVNATDGGIANTASEGITATGGTGETAATGEQRQRDALATTNTDATATGGSSQSQGAISLQEAARYIPNETQESANLRIKQAVDSGFTIDEVAQAQAESYKETQNPDADTVKFAAQTKAAYMGNNFIRPTAAQVQAITENGKPAFTESESQMLAGNRMGLSEPIWDKAVTELRKKYESITGKPALTGANNGETKEALAVPVTGGAGIRAANSVGSVDGNERQVNANPTNNPNPTEPASVTPTVLGGMSVPDTNVQPNAGSTATVATEPAVVPKKAKADLAPIPKTSPEISAEQKRQQEIRRKRVAKLTGYTYAKSPFLAFLGSNGVKLSLKSEFSPDKNPILSGYGPMFRRNGLSLDALTEQAVQDGFLPPDTNDDTAIYELINRQMSGESIAPLYTEDGTTNAMEAEIARRAQFEEDAAFEELSQVTYTTEELEALEDIPWDTPVGSGIKETTRQAMEAMGFSEQEIQDEIAREQRIAQEASQSSNSASQAETSQPREGATATTEQSGEGLTAPTRADVLAQQQQRDAESQRREQGGDAPLPVRKVTADTPDMFNTQGSVFDVPAEVIIPADGKDNAIPSNGSKLSKVKQKDNEAVLKKAKPQQSQSPATINPTDKKSIVAAIEGIFSGMKDAWARISKHTEIINSTDVADLIKAKPYLQAVQNSITAYHGSPYRFNEFSLDHLGKGEGAQAYGWGLYFADSKDVAEYYKKVLTEQGLFKKDGTLFDEKSEIKNLNVRVALRKSNGDVDSAIARAKEVEPNEQFGNQAFNAARQDVETLEQIKKEGGLTRNTGQTYRVNIKPAEDTFLLWDKPLSEQPQKVRDALANMLKTAPDGWGQKTWLNTVKELGASPRGEDIYRLASSGNDKGISLQLAKLGIAGIKYLDGTSRDSGKGSYNYVVFDDKAVEIVEAYYSRGDDAKVQAFYDPTDKKIYVIADRIKKGTEASVWLHEVFHKRGEELLGKDNLKKLYDNVQGWKTRKPDSVERQIYEAANARASAATNSPTITPETQAKLRKEVGEIEGAFYEATGRRFDELTNSEGNFILRDVGKFRTNLAARGNGQGNGNNAESLQRATYQQEFLTYAIEEANNRGVTPDAKKSAITAAGWLAKVKSLFTNALRKLLSGYAGKIDISANDLMAMAYGSAKLEYEDKTAETKTLITQHNLTEENLIFANKIGGLAVPSIAVTNVDSPIGGFGEITLLGDVNMADPKQGAKMYGADIYSPRYPSLTLQVTKDGLTYIKNKLAGFGEISAYDVKDIDSLTQSKVFKKYAEANGARQGYYGDYKKIAQELLLESKPDEKIFTGFSYSGNKKYVPHTLDKVISILKKDLRGGENFNYGVGRLRAKVTPQFKTIAQIKLNKDRLVSKEQFEKIKKEVDDELIALSNDLGVPRLDILVSILEDSSKLGYIRAAKQYDIEATQEDAEKANVYLQKLKNLPTEYFEGKLLRAVGVNEFKSAVVPSGIGITARKILNDSGVKIYEYDEEINGDRESKIKIAVQEGKDLLFSQSPFDGIEKARTPLGDTKTVMVDGKEYSVFNSDGKPIHGTVEGVRNFVRWFGESKVTDNGKTMAQGGKPLVAYHGTDKVFTTFKTEKTVDGSFWFTSDQLKLKNGESGAAAQGVIIPVYLGSDNLAGWDSYDKYSLEELRQQGYDGVKLDDDYIVFNPSKIKSTGNTGDFNPANPDIRFSRASSIDETLEIIKTGKLPDDNRSYSEIKDLLVTKLTDSTRPHDVWTRVLPDQGDAATLIQAKNLASGRESAFNKEVMDNFGSRVSAAAGAIHKANKDISTEAALRLGGDWMSARFAMIANQNLLKKDTKALQDAVTTANDLSTEKAELDADRAAINKHIASGNTTLKTVDFIAMLQRREMRLNKQIKALTNDINGSSLDVDERREAALFDLEQQLEEAVLAQKDARKSVSVSANNADARRELLLIDREIAKLGKRTGNAKAAVTRAKDTVLKRQAAITDKRVIDPSKQKLDIGLAGGYNDATAKQMMMYIEERIDVSLLEDLANVVYEMNDWKLKKDIELGKVTKEMAAQFDKSGKYVPLTGDPRADETAADVFGTGSTNQGKDRAMQGRTSGIAQNGIDASFEQVQKTARYYGWADYKDALHGIYEKSIKKYLADGSTQQEAQRKTTEGLGISRSPETMQRPSDDVIIYRKNGEAWVYDIGNKAAIDALRSANVEPIPTAYRYVALATRAMARLVTQFMPGFAPVNALRDTWEKSENIRTRVAPNYPDMDMNKVARTMLGQSLKSLTTLHKSIMPVVAQGTPVEAIAKLDPNNADQKLMIQFLKDGGASTWGQFLSTDGKDLAEKLGKMHKLPTKAVDTLDVWNNSWELISSFSVYKALRENGMDSKAASNMALELMNFRKGGELMKPIKALYMFAQPIATGGHQLLQTLDTRRGKVRFAAYAAIGFLLYGMLRSGEDDDELGINRMDNRPNYEIERSIIIPYGDAGKSIAIPIGFGLPMLAWTYATNIAKMTLGKQTASETAIELLVKTPVKTFAPVAPSESSISKNPFAWMVQTLTPTIGKPIANVALDRTAFGGSLTSSRFEKPDKANALEGRLNTPEFYKDAAKELANVGLDTYPEVVREIIHGYFIGALNVAVKAAIDNPAKEARGKEQVSQFIDRWVKNQDRDDLKQRLYYRYREELNDVGVKASLGKTLDNKQTAMLKILEETKKDETSVRTSKAQATKKFGNGKNPAIYEAELKRVETKQSDIQVKLIRKMNELDAK